MSDTVTMPKLGFDMQEGTLVRWVKSEGEEVQKGEVLAEIETDKATVEVESSYTGTIARHLVGKGDIVPVGTPIAIIAAPGENVEEVAASAPSGQSAEEAPAADTQKAPTISGGEQAAAEMPGQAVESPAGQQIQQDQDRKAEKPVEEIPAGEESVEPVGDGRIKASPLARRVAQEQGIDLSRIKGTGPGGRIVRSDVEAAARTAQQAPAAPQPVPVPVWTGAVSVPEDERVKTSRLRQIIGRRMVEAKQQIPHIYVTRAYRFEKVMELRKQMNAFLPDDQKLTVNDFILKAVALTLRQLPNINASLQGDEIVRHGHVNVGSAVALDDGLMTVVVKDADQKPLRLISAEMRELVARARSGKVRPDDIEGSTFSVSNLGMYGVEDFVAVINSPEAAILAVGAAQEVPVVENGELKVGLQMKATISADHRITDGAEAARFLQILAMYIEEPMRLLL